MSIFSSNSKDAVQNAGASGRIRDRATRARAQDVRARGGNPVTVADVRQRHSTSTGQGRAIDSRWLSWLS